MGLFKKIFKGIGNVFKKIGGFIMKGFQAVGKFMNKFGILGQIGMMFISSWVGGWAFQALGKLGSGMMGKLAIAAQKGNSLAKAALTVVNGVKSIAQIPKAILNSSKKVLGSITDTVVGTVTDTLRYIGDKTGISAVLRNSKLLPEMFKPEALQRFQRGTTGELLRDETGKLIKTGTAAVEKTVFAPGGLNPEGADAIFKNLADRFSNIGPNLQEGVTSLTDGITRGVKDFGDVLTGNYKTHYETYMVDGKSVTKDIQRNLGNREDYNLSLKENPNRTSISPRGPATKFGEVTPSDPYTAKVQQKDYTEFLEEPGVTFDTTGEAFMKQLQDREAQDALQRIAPYGVDIAEATGTLAKDPSAIPHWSRAVKGAMVQTVSQQMQPDPVSWIPSGASPIAYAHSRSGQFEPLSTQPQPIVDFFEAANRGDYASIFGTDGNQFMSETPYSYAETLYDRDRGATPQSPYFKDMEETYGGGYA